MPLVRKLDEDEWSILEILSDPIWCGEFLRNTADGDTNRDLWPPKKFKYRGYQRQVLSDQSEFILYTGGRSIGKCQPMSSRVYTTEGYKKISELAKKRYFTVFCLDKQFNLVQRRAICIQDEQKAAFTIISEEGHSVVGTDNHPILTDNGYKLIQDITTEDYIAVTTRLPWTSGNSQLRWHELRFLGYWLLHDGLLSASSPIKSKTRRIEKELELIANDFLCGWKKDEFGNFQFTKRAGPFKHNICVLMDHCGIYSGSRPQITSIPKILMMECLDNLKLFIEALFAQYSVIRSNSVKIELPHKQIALDIQELLLRFGIESKITDLPKRQHIQYRHTDMSPYMLELLDRRALLKFFDAFDLPGFSINLPYEQLYSDPYPNTKFVKVAKKFQSHEICDTYAIHVYEFNNYITENIYVHNSIVLQDKIIHEIINARQEFSETLEEVFITPNQSQQTKIISEITSRFTDSKFLKHFVKKRANKTEGTMVFDIGGKQFTFFFRIAGDSPEKNMISMHAPKIRCDECQLFSWAAYNHLQGGYNNWETPRQQMFLGVTNGLRNTTLYILDKKTPHYKKYRIPSHNNPFYSYEQNIADIKRFGGEQSDGYQNMVLGRHGSASYQVISREDITIETFPFTNNRYYSAHKYKGKTYTDLLTLPKLPEYIRLVLAVDPAFTDSCIIQLLLQDKKGIWRCVLRYRLQRIDPVEQEKIIDWIATHYSILTIAIDVGAGGQGPAIYHSLVNREDYKNKNYDKRVVGINFNEQIVTGYNDQGEELTTDAKSVGVDELVRLITEEKLVFSEIDQEGISEIERIARTRGISGRNIYFILGKGEKGKDEEDHIFASFLCFALAIKSNVEYHVGKRVGRAVIANTIY